MNRFLLVNKSALQCRALSFVTATSAQWRTSFSPLLFNFFALFFLLAVGAHAQSSNDVQVNADYQKTIYERSAKIVNTLGITDSVKYKKVQTSIANQYFALAAVQDKQTAAVADIKKQFPEKDKQAEAIKPLEEKKSVAVMQLHNNFIAQLKADLSEEQVEKVKDGLTYRVMPLTYAAYLDEVQTLTEEQKTKIFDWLKEARELAMDAESSDKKHAVFGKYKGRINNYLSAAGYDMKKEGEAWQKRLQAAKESKQTQH